MKASRILAGVVTIGTMLGVALPSLANDQLRLQVMDQLRQHQITVVDARALTDRQITEIEAVLSSTDSAQEKRERIARIVATRG